MPSDAACQIDGLPIANLFEDSRRYTPYFLQSVQEISLLIDSLTPKNDGGTRVPALELLNPNRTICALDFSERIHYNIKEFGVQPQTDFFKNVEAYRSGHNGLDSKSSDPEMGPWVRIPPLPPNHLLAFDTRLVGDLFTPLGGKSAGTGAFRHLFTKLYSKERFLNCSNRVQEDEFASCTRSFLPHIGFSTDCIYTIWAKWEFHGIVFFQLCQLATSRDIPRLRATEKPHRWSAAGQINLIIFCQPF